MSETSTSAQPGGRGLAAGFQRQAAIHLLWAMGAHSASHGNVNPAMQPPRGRGLVVVARAALDLCTVAVAAAAAPKLDGLNGRWQRSRVDSPRSAGFIRRRRRM